MLALSADKRCGSIILVAQAKTLSFKLQASLDLKLQCPVQGSKMARYLVQCASYNGNLGKGSPTNPDISSWLAPTLSGNSSSSTIGNHTKNIIPDVIAIGFQEMIPLHLSLVGLTTTAVDMHDGELKRSIESHANSLKGGAGMAESYTLLAKKGLGGIVLLVYTRDSTLTRLVADVRVATVGTGLLRLMGNKGAVGVRITLNSEDEKSDEEETVMTFVTAHLAAHDYALQRRNEDWQSIVERLVFTPEERSDNFSLGSKSAGFNKLKGLASKSGKAGSQIYDTSYCEFPASPHLHLLDSLVTSLCAGLLYENSILLWVS